MTVRHKRFTSYLISAVAENTHSHAVKYRKTQTLFCKKTVAHEIDSMQLNLLSKNV